MVAIERCLAEITAVREVAAGTAAPYVARSRIGRLALSAALFVAEKVDCGPRVPPGGLRPSEQVAQQLHAIAERSKRIAEIARHIAQPSEPLAERWMLGWGELLSELDRLEGEFKQLQRGEA